MPSAPLLDFTTLLAPIPGDDNEPAGFPRIPFEFEQKLNEARIEVIPDEDDTTTEVKKADWPLVIRTAQQVLTQKSKHLLAAARLTEALTKQYGFAGFRDGLRLFREMIEQLWEVKDEKNYLNPPIEDGDVEVRAGPFYWLDDPDKGARFPTTLRRVPIIIAGSGAYGWLEWRQSQDGKGVSREDLEKAILTMPYDKFKTITEDLDQGVEELTKLTQVLGEKMGGAAPALTGVRLSLDECRQLALQILRRKAPEGPAPQAEDAPGGGQAGASGGGGGASALSAAHTRDEAYRQLQAAATLLRQLEPHSPIPYFVERAVQLGALPFPDLIRVLIRDATVLSELNRELGIKEPEQQ